MLFLVLLQIHFKSFCGPNDHWYDEAFHIPHSLHFYGLDFYILIYFHPFLSDGIATFINDQI
jgi:hypothetical protein